MSKKCNRLKNFRAFSVVEVLLAIAVLVLLVTAIVGAIIYGWQDTVLAGMRQRAAMLAEEGLEAVRSIRDENFDNLSDGQHGLAISSNKWFFSGTHDITDIFTRQITVSTIDVDTKQVISTVTWQQSPQRTGTVSLTTYFTNWQARSFCGWANPKQVSSLNLSGTADGLKVQVQGDYAYMVRNGGIPDFVVIDVTNPVSPLLIGSLDLPGTPRNIAVSGDYAYIASDSNTSELQIVDISNPAAPSFVGVYNAVGNADAMGVYVENTMVYLVRWFSLSPEFYIISVKNPVLPVLIGSLNLGGNAYEVTKVSNYAYIASGQNEQELQVIDVSNPVLPVQVGSYDLPGNSDCVSVAGFTGTILLGRSGGPNELLVFDITNPTNPILLGQHNATGVVNDISLGESNLCDHIATSARIREYQIVDITVRTAPALVGQLDMVAAVNGVAYDAIRDTTYLVGTADTAEFVVVQR